ncbi:MAG: carboxylate--amine ligase [Ignavibacteriales bacterium]|nr:carboxylate--amine ligase [Ignavibacteriales bacterium]
MEERIISHKIDNSTPVVVLKTEHYGSLGIIRSLGRLGVPVYGVDANPHAPSFWSRYCAGQFLWDMDNASHEESIHFLLHVKEKIGGTPILIPTSDETSLFVADHAEILAPWFIFPHQSADLVRSLCSKKEMFFLATRLGIPTARTEFPQSRFEVLRYLRTLQFPVMLKGIDGRRLEVRTGKKMVVVHNERELLKRYETMEDAEHPNLMLQEYIPGGDDSVWMFNGYFDERSECLAEFTGKKIHQNPVYVGMTALGVCVWNKAVAGLTKRFMKAINYRGILDIGFRYDWRDGQYKVLDVNPRIGATFRLFVGENGMDVVRALYLDLTGQTVPSSAQREGRKWIVEDKDILSTYHYLREGKLTVKEWFRSMKGIEEAGYFSIDDLRPFLAMVASHLRKMLIRIGKNVGLLTIRKKKGARIKAPQGRHAIGEKKSAFPHGNLSYASQLSDYDREKL